MKKRIISVAMIFVVVVVMSFASVETAFAATKKVHFKDSTAYVQVGSTYTAKLLNESGKKISASKIVWSTADKSIATVSKKGVVKGKKIGTVTITGKYNGKKYTFKTKVNDTHIGIERTKLNQGETLAISLKDYRNKICDETVVWSVSDPSIALLTLDAEGKQKVTVSKEGTFDIVASGTNAIYTKTVTVYKPELSNPGEIYTGETAKINLKTWQVSDGKTKRISTKSGVQWSSDDTGIATVDCNGKIHGISEGKTTITATYGGNKYSKDIEVFGSFRIDKDTISLSQIGEQQVVVVTIKDENVLLSASYASGKAFSYSKWSNKWDDFSIKLYITARKPGTSVIKIINKNNLDDYKLITVNVNKNDSEKKYEYVNTVVDNDYIPEYNSSSVKMNIETSLPFITKFGATGATVEVNNISYDVLGIGGIGVTGEYTVIDSGLDKNICCYFELLDSNGTIVDSGILFNQWKLQDGQTYQFYRGMDIYKMDNYTLRIKDV